MPNFGNGLRLEVADIGFNNYTCKVNVLNEDAFVAFDSMSGRVMAQGGLEGTLRALIAVMHFQSAVRLKKGEQTLLAKDAVKMLLENDDVAFMECAGGELARRIKELDGKPTDQKMLVDFLDPIPGEDFA